MITRIRHSGCGEILAEVERASSGDWLLTTYPGITYRDEKNPGPKIPEVNQPVRYDWHGGRGFGVEQRVKLAIEPVSTHTLECGKCVDRGFVTGEYLLRTANTGKRNVTLPVHEFHYSRSRRGAVLPFS